MDSLQKAGQIGDAIYEWVKWAEETHGEEFVYISEDLIQDLANFIISKTEA